MRISPLENEVLCRKIESVKITKGGILIPSNFSENSDIYEVLAISKQVQDMSILSTHDIVMVSEEDITGFNFGKEIDYFVDIKNILAILED